MSHLCITITIAIHIIFIALHQFYNAGVIVIDWYIKKMCCVRTF